MKTGLKLFFLGILIYFAAACQPIETALPRIETATPIAYTGSLEPIATITPPPVNADGTAATLTPVPSPTPTPRTHQVALNETMISIAIQYGLNYDELQAANPEADPYTLVVGQTLIIPASSDETEDEVSGPIPAPLTLNPVHCTPDAADGLWCLLSARAPKEAGRENIAASITLNGAGSNEALDVIASAPLNRLDAGERMPLAVYIDAETLREAPFTAPYQAQAELIQALPLNNTAGRYLELSLTTPEAAIAADGESALIQTTLTLAADSPQSASQIWLAAAAYNAADVCIGLRRWAVETPLAQGESATISLTVFSVNGSAIDHVEVLAEARP